MIGNYSSFDVTIIQKNNTFRFINIDAQTEVESLKEAKDILTNLKKIITHNLTCAGDQNHSYSLSNRDIAIIIEEKTINIINDLEKFKLYGNVDDRRIINTLYDNIYEYTSKRIGIQSLDISSTSIFLDFLSLKDSSSFMRTSKKFYKVLKPLISIKHAKVKLIFKKRVIERRKIAKIEYYERLSQKSADRMLRKADTMR